jgi:hypothetical protein
MPQELNRDPTGQGTSGANWDNSGSASYQGSGSTPGLGAVQDTVARAKEEAARLSSEAARQAKAQARSLGEEAKERAARYAEGGKEVVTEHLDAFAQAIRKAGEELSERDQTMAAQVVRHAARGLEGLSRSVGGTTFEDVIDSVRRFGRSHPAAFIGGAVLAGLALGRFVRSSGHNSLDDAEGDWRDLDDRGPGTAGEWSERRFAADHDAAPPPYAGSSYPAGEGASFAPPSRAMGETAGAPAPAQGYAGGGMGTATRPSPSSATEPSVTASDYSGGSEPGAISTGGTS